jgi:hypothetical protein
MEVGAHVWIRNAEEAWVRGIITSRSEIPPSALKSKASSTFKKTLRDEPMQGTATKKREDEENSNGKNNGTETQQLVIEEKETMVRVVVNRNGRALAEMALPSPRSFSPSSLHSSTLAASEDSGWTMNEVGDAAGASEYFAFELPTNSMEAPDLKLSHEGDQALSEDLINLPYLHEPSMLYCLLQVQFLSFQI